MPPTLRIGMVCPYSLSRPGGVQGQALGLARALERHGHRVTVVAPVDGATAAVGGDVELLTAGPSVSVRANGSAAPVGLDPRATARVLRVVRAGGFDVLHVHEPLAPLVAPALLADPTGPPVVATFHRSGTDAGYRALRPVAAVLARRLGVAVAVSEAARTTAASVLGRAGLRALAAGGGGGRGAEVIEVLFNGVDVDGLAGADPWPRPEGSGGGPVVLFLGRHEERKGLSVLLDAVGTLWSGGEGAGGHGPPFRLWIAGDGPATAALRHRWDGLAGVEWLGVVGEEEKARRLAAADVVCAPSLGGESFGLVLVEGMAAGAVVVASDIDGYRQAAGDAAVLVPPGDAGALAAALRSVLEGSAALGRGRSGSSGPPSRAGWLDAARARAGTWSLDTLAATYEGCYRRAIDGVGAGTAVHFGP